jgi:hypothetical protein
VWNVRRRNPSFVGRDDLLAALRDALANQAPTATQTLHGIGGSGKSSLAVEYAHRFAGDYDPVWWVDAEDPTTIRSQLGGLAVAAGLVAPRADVEPKVSAAQAWLRRTSRWLVLFDAAESPLTLFPLLPDGTGHVRSADDFRRSSELTEQLLARLREAVGEDHPQTIGAMISLAVDRRQLGSFDVARTPDEAVLSRSRKLLGENHPHTLGAASNLAIDLHELGEFEAARQVNEDVLTRRRGHLGENHPATLVSASNLAANLGGLDQAAQAARPRKIWWRVTRRGGGSSMPSPMRARSCGRGPQSDTTPWSGRWRSG